MTAHRSRGGTVARQEQDFNKEKNQQSAAIVVKDSHGVTIDLTEIQCAQVLQFLLTIYRLQGRREASGKVGDKGLLLLKLLGRHPDGELQDVEVNTLLQRQSIHIENCTDVRINQVEVEKVVETGLELAGLIERRSADGTPTGDGI
jgi:hypothetical protein